ncbi:hypothetical protein ACDZ29_25580 [Peribacillus sp. RS7]|uniref:hypothetical protein n=1 Tax=Peribacillus sp. RS7 TaxID=3242679 RepID=UPI0035C19CFE
MKDKNFFLTPSEAAVLVGFNKSSAKGKKYQDLMVDFFGCNFEREILERDVSFFLENHFSLSILRDKVMEITPIKEQSFSTVYKSVFSFLDIQPVYFSNKLDCIYLKGEDYKKCLRYYKKISNHSDSKLFYKYEISRILKIKDNKIDDILKEHEIQPYIKTERRSLYSESDLEKLKSIQANEIQKFNKHYISIEEVALNLNCKNQTVVNWLHSNDIKSIFPPSIVKIKIGEKDYTGTKKYIPIEIAERYIRVVEFREMLEGTFIKYDVEIDALLTFKQLMVLYGYSFSSSAQITEKYWTSFVKRKILETEVRDLKGFVHQFVLATGFLVNIINSADKELFNFSTKEINLSLLNDAVPYKYKEKFYSFIKDIQEELIRRGSLKIFDIYNLRSPRMERKINNIPKMKVIYKPEVFVSLIKYCSETKYYIMHKKKALKDAKLFGKSEYREYANMWLYVIIQLNNSWRHADVIDFPRLEGMYQDKNLDWLEHYEITQEDAEIIVAYYESQSYLHSKNNMPRYFIMSDDLKISFATAVLICELLRREYDTQIHIADEVNKSLNNLIKFEKSGNIPSPVTHNNFFSNFEYKLKFENRKINWTLTTLATDVISKLSGRNPMEIAKFLRNHSDEEITNIYVQLPQEYVDYIAKQLFNLGSFGYIYDTMSQILFEGATKLHDFSGAMVMKNTFGSPEIIENLSKKLVAMDKSRDLVIEILKQTPKEEIQEKINLIDAGVMPSKNVEFQCLIGISNCPYPKVDCFYCTLSIPNRLAICKVGIDIHQTLDEIIENYEKTPYEAEKVRLAGKFFLQRTLLNSAINKFGRSSINQLIPGGLNAINQKLAIAPKSRDKVSDGLINRMKKEGMYLG